MEANAGESSEYSVLVSCVPWFHFEAVTLPDFTFRQSRPIITYGRLKDGEIPVNIRAHHAFVDGKHIIIYEKTPETIVSGVSHFHRTSFTSPKFRFFF